MPCHTHTDIHLCHRASKMKSSNSHGLNDPWQTLKTKWLISKQSRCERLYLRCFTISKTPAYERSSHVSTSNKSALNADSKALQSKWVPTRLGWSAKFSWLKMTAFPRFECRIVYSFSYLKAGAFATISPFAE